MFAQPKPIASVVFSWDQIGDVTFVIEYNGEEIYPLYLWYSHDGQYESKEAKQSQSKLIYQGRLLAGKFYRMNKITFTFWDYIKSFFVTPPQVGLQRYVLFDDGTEGYEGPPDDLKLMFIGHCRKFLDDFKQFQQLRYHT